MKTTQERDRENTAQLRSLADRHGPEILGRIREMILERAESFPDRERSVKWIISVSRDGKDITLEVQP